MMDRFSIRYECANAYLIRLRMAWSDRAPDRVWRSLYQDIDRLKTPDVMALLHPRFYLENERYKAVTSQQKKCFVRGARAFPENTRPQMMACECESYWGYRCSGDWVHGEDIVASKHPHNKLVLDHSFPYTLGGITHVDNRRVLCGLHNGFKSNDMHLWQWEDWIAATPPAPKWALSSLGKIESLLR